MHWSCPDRDSWRRVREAVEAKDPEKTPWTNKIVKDFNECAQIDDKFHVVVQTKFPPVDYAEYLEKDLPLAKMKHLIVTVDDQ